MINSASVPIAQPILVTPAMAATWLENNSSNRRLRPGVVNQYSRDMQSGNWAYVGDPIKMSHSDRLLDGQHRLSAIVKSGCTILLPVIRGLDDSAQKFMDKAAKRQIADTLKMDGYINAALLASVAKIGVAFDSGDATLGRSVMVSDSEVEQFIHENPDIIDAVNIVSEHARRVMCQPSAAAFASWLIYVAVKDWEPIKGFWEAASTKVGLKSGDPVIAMTNKFAADRAQRKVTPRRALISVIIRTWNYRREGKPLMQIKYQSNDGKGGFVEIPAVKA